MANPAAVVDLEARWRPLTGQERTNAQTFLVDAWAYLTAELPTLDQRLTDGEVSDELVTAAVCAMVLRVLRNPDGKRQESIDDYAWTRDQAVSAGLLYATSDELARLSGGTTAAAFSITPWQAPESA